MENLSPEVAQLRPWSTACKPRTTNSASRPGIGSVATRHNIKRINDLERKYEPTPMVFRALISA